jgi:excisionase family DNA binding protein
MVALLDAPTLLSTHEVARQLGVSSDTIRRAVKDGRIEPVRLRERGWLRFRRADVERLVAGSS